MNGFEHLPYGAREACLHWIIPYKRKKAGPLYTWTCLKFQTFLPRWACFAKGDTAHFLLLSMYFPMTFLLLDRAVLQKACYAQARNVHFWTLLPTNSPAQVNWFCELHGCLVTLMAVGKCFTIATKNTKPIQPTVVCLQQQPISEGQM